MHSRIVRFCITLSVFSVLAYSGCSEKRDSISLGPVSQANKRGPILDPRPNPLQEYIQDEWVNGSSTATGGAHYSHIKVFGFSHANLEGYQDDADFIAEHFDAYVWGGPIVGDRSAVLNPDMLWFHEATHIPSIRTGYDSTRAAEWIGLTPSDVCVHGKPRPGNNAQGHGWDDLLMLYKYNTTNWVSTALGLPYIPGWNPADDTDGDGCIEAGEGNNGQPSESNRSAQDYWDARVRLRVGQGKYWMLEDVTSAASIAFTVNEANYEYDTWDVEGFHFDEGAYQPLSLGLNNTFKYEGLSETSTSFPYQTDKLAFVPAAMADVETHIGNPTIAFANMVSSNYLCNLPLQYEGALDYLETVFLENWIGVDASSYSVTPATTSKRAQLLECTSLDFLGGSKGILFGCLDPNNSERGKLFTLGMFYMINHQLAFYYYRVLNHDGHDVEQTQWNPWVQYDVGQPVANNLGKLDFQGNSGTDKFFVFASGSTYQILGRQFLRSDGQRILVLVKLMADGQTEGAGSANHALGAGYHRLQSDFTWSTQSSQVTLTNNNAVILKKYVPQCQECEPEG